MQTNGHMWPKVLAETIRVQAALHVIVVVN